MLLLFQQQSSEAPEVSEDKEPLDSEEALKAYHGLRESKK